jgi:Uma2 family endonuclease
MATAAAVPIEEFWKLVEQGELVEYVDGEVIEKPMALLIHGKIQASFGDRLRKSMEPFGGTAAVNVHCRLGERKMRLPDIVAYDRPMPDYEYPDLPALVTVEVASPSDRFSDLLRKCQEYADWGVPHIWMIDPERRGLYEFSSGRLRPVESFSIPEYGIAFSPADIFPE